jgi:hypothetical protein
MPIAGGMDTSSEDENLEISTCVDPGARLKAVFNWVCRVDITASKQSSRCRWKEEKSIPGARRVEAVSIDKF